MHACSCAVDWRFAYSAYSISINFVEHVRSVTFLLIRLANPAFSEHVGQLESEVVKVHVRMRMRPNACADMCLANFLS